MKILFKKIYWFLGIDITKSLDSGVSFFGINFAKLQEKYLPRGEIALQKCLALNPETVLDVGSGGGHHAKEFTLNNAQVTCIDFGTSVYATKEDAQKNIHVININFLEWKPDRRYELVWASHVLEHQQNVGLFIEKLVACSMESGYIAITVPFPHRRLYGGHLTMWTPGLLAYNIALCGIDLSKSQLFYGFREFTIIFKPIKVTLPPLTFDSGDITKIKKYLPSEFIENGDPWI